MGEILEYYWPNAKHYEDITKTDFTIHRGTVDILTGGFPCQPFSQAGKRKGTEDDRHLWPRMLEVIREVQPRWVVGENVYGLVNWDGGLVFDQVCLDLEAEGYEVQPIILPAVAVNAPHRRDRIWFVAYRNSNGLNRCNGKHEINPSQRGVNALNDVEQNEVRGYASNTKQCDMENKRNEQGSLGKENSRRETGGFKHGDIQANWDSFPTTEPTIRSRDDELSSRLDGITFPKWRVESIKAYGNAVVPQLVFEIFKVINEMEGLK
jgi:DNA (cytosine-5)-methyltransferase 1